VSQVHIEGESTRRPRLTGLRAAATIVVVPLRLLLFAVVLLLAAPTVAQAFGPPQLFWRPYLPGAEVAWQPLNGAAVNVFEPEVGILIDADPVGKDPGRAITVTHVPDHGTASDALRYAGECFTLPGGAGKVVALGQLPFRGFGAYTIHSFALTNAQAMSSLLCDLTGAPASDTNFTVNAVPTLSLVLGHAQLDDDSNENIVAQVTSSAAFQSFPADYVCARNARAAADGTPSGADRRTINNARDVGVVDDLGKVGHWSCAARLEVPSEGDNATFTGPWGPLLNFDVTDLFRFQRLALSSLGGTRYALSGRSANNGAAGGKVRATFVRGKRCPGGPKTIRKTLAVNAAGRFTARLALPEGGSSGYISYGWKVKIEFLGTSLVRPAKQVFGIEVGVRSSGGQRHYRKTRVAQIEDASAAACVKQPIFHLP
jgi:hypothetical protein